MSKSVDERIVEMRFDNQQFERNVQTTMGTLDELKQSLKLDGASKGLNDIDKAAKNVSLDGIAAGVDALQKRFSTLGIVGMRVIQNLTDSVMGFAKNTVGFVTDSIINGGKRRAMNIENAHFQLQGLLKDEEKVQAVMQDAMDSVDGTAYAYDEAAKAASQFAASGMQAGEEMQSSLRAITGVAAMTNSEYENISQIFTTVAGNGRLMGDQLLQLSSRGLNAAATIKDYFNGVNNGTVEASESVSAAITELTNGLDVTEGDIRDFVSKGEISFQVFSAALDDAFGEHAKKANETFTGAMANVKAALARIGAEFFSPLIVQNGPLVTFFNTLRERVNDVKSNIGPLATLFTDSVTSMADAATKYLGQLDLTKHFESFYNIVDSVRNVLSGIGSVLKPVVQGFRDIFPPVAIEAVADFTARMKELTANFRLNDKDAENLRSTFKGLFAVLDLFRKAVGSVVKAIFPMTEGVGGLASGILSITGKIGECLALLNESAGPVFETLDKHISGTVTTVKEFAKMHFGSPDISGLESFADRLQTRFSPLEKICAGVKMAIGKVADAFAAAAPILAKAGGSIVDAIRNVLHGDGFDSLTDLMNGGLMVGIGAGIMKFIENLQATVSKAGGMFSNVNRILFNVKNTLISYQASLKAEVLLKIAKAIAILAASLLVLSLIDSDKLGGALAAITILFGELSAAMAVFDKTLSGKGGLIRTGMAMVEMSVALLILSAALKKLAGIDTDKLAGALGSITVLIGELVAASIALSKWGKKTQSSAFSMILFAEAINILAKAVGKLAGMDTDMLAKGLMGVGILMAEMAAFMAASKFGNFKATQGLAIIELAGALLILEKAVAGFGAMDMDILGKGLLGVAGTLAAITAAMRFMPKNMIGIGLGLIEVAAALKVIGSVLQSSGGMKWEEIGKGLLVLASSMAILAVSLHAMKGTLGASAAMFVMATALAIFTPVLKSFGNMSLPEIGKAILMLASAFAVFGIAGAVLGPMVPTILGLSAALALLGVAVAACGLGVLALSAGLAALAVSGTAGMAALVAGLEILVTGILNIIAHSGKAITEAVKTIVLSIVNVVVECAPAIAEGVLVLIEEILESLASHAPNIVAFFMDFLIGVLNSVAERMPELIQAAVNFLGAFFQGVVDALKGIDTTTLIEGIVGIGLLSAIMIALSTVAGLIPSAMIGVIGMGAVIAEIALVLAAVGAFAQIPGLKWLISEGGDLLQEIGVAIGKFAGGIIGGMMGGISSQFPKIGADLSAFMANVRPFIEGAGQIDSGAMNGVKALAETILVLTAANVLDGLSKWFTGGSSLAKFGEELAKFGPYFKTYYDSINGIEGTTVESSANAAKALAAFAKDIPNEGGVAGWFMGENSLSKFADELIQFGPKLKTYADSVTGLKADVVVNSANAAKALSEMANNLPNQGGVAGWFAGENNLSLFAEELAAFGPKLKAYADSVTGLKANVVVNSTNAAKALSEMANNLPNQGGAVSWFTGDNTLSVFADELIQFGPKLKAYANSVTGLKADVVVNSTNAAKALAELANNLPNTGGAVSWFTGDNDIAAFGESLQAFGKSFADYYQSVNVTQLDEVSAAMKKLVDLANSISGTNASGLAKFADELQGMGKKGVDAFIKAFTDSDAKVADAASNMLSAFIKGAKSEQNNMNKTLSAIAIDSLSAIKEKHGDFESAGKSVMEEFAAGMKGNSEAVKSSVLSTVEVAISSIREKYSGLYSAGAYLVDGFLKGISDNISKVVSQAQVLAQAVTDATRTQLGVHSPSKVFAEIGGYVVDGFVGGINKNKGKAVQSAERLAEVGIAAAKAVAESLKQSDSVFSDFVEKTDENGNAVEITLEKAAEAFKSFRDSVKSSVKDAMGVFDAFEVETDITGKQLLKNLKSQITGITEWAANIRLLADRGINKGLLKVLSDMGPSGAKYVSALASMSDKELKKLNKLYKQRMSLNDKAADEITASFLEGGEKAAKAYTKGLTKSNSKQKAAVASQGKAFSADLVDGSVSAMESLRVRLKETVGWSYKDAVKEMKSSLDYGKGAFQQFVNSYLSATKNITIGNKAIKAASQAISTYGKKLYEESEYYEEDTANLKTHKEELSSLQSQRSKLQKQLKKAQTSNKKDSKTRVKTLKQELDANKKAIDAAKKQVKDDEKEIAEHTKEVFNNMRSTLSESVSAFLDPLKVSLESGIDLFKKWESNSDLYEADKKNLEEYQKSLAELEETQKNLQNEISKYSDQNTLAARKRVKELKSQLSEVESSIEEAKRNVEQAENDMASHSEVTVTSILENMQSQVNGVAKWQQNLQTLAGKGVSQGLLDKLKEMGPDGVDYVEQFMKMTSEEIAKANDLYAQSENLTSQTLLNNFKDALSESKNWAEGLQKMAQMGFSQDLLEKLGGMGVDGYEYVKAFLAMTPAQVAEFNKQFADSLKLPDTVADQVISSYAYAGGLSISGFTSALAKLAESGSDENEALVAATKEIVNSMESTLTKESRSAGTKAVEALANGITANKKYVKSCSKTLGNETLNSFKKVFSDKSGKTVAGNMIEGLRIGLSDGKSAVSSMARTVAKEAYNAAKSELGIKSPSRKFAELGRYTDEGFVQGLMSGEDGVYQTASDIMGSVIKEVSDAINSDIDAQPTIRPVMDLSEIQNGAENIGKMMDGYAISSTAKLADMASNGINRSGLQSDESMLNAIAKLQNTLLNLLDRPNIEQHNEFSISGENPREIANEVSRILQQQVERRNAVWV